MDVDGVRTMTVGTILWGVLAIALLSLAASLLMKEVPLRTTLAKTTEDVSA